MTRILLAHAPGAEAQAKRIAAQLSTLGFLVSQSAGLAPRRAQAARLETAQKVVVLWSRADRGTPALRATARRAQAKGTLVSVALDAAPPPVGARPIRAPRESKAWRRVLATRASESAPAGNGARYPRPAKARRIKQTVITTPPRPLPKPPRRPGAPVLGVLASLALIAVAAGSEAYVRDPGFAARVNALAQTTQTRAAEIIDTITGRTARDS